MVTGVMARSSAIPARVMGIFLGTVLEKRSEGGIIVVLINIWSEIVIEMVTIMAIMVILVFSGVTSHPEEVFSPGKGSQTTRLFNRQWEMCEEGKKNEERRPPIIKEEKGKGEEG